MVLLALRVDIKYGGEEGQTGTEAMLVSCIVLW